MFTFPTTLFVYSKQGSCFYNEGRVAPMRFMTTVFDNGKVLILEMLYRIYVCVCVCIHTQTYIYTHTYVYMCVCVYMERDVMYISFLGFEKPRGMMKNLRKEMW